MCRGHVEDLEAPVAGPQASVATNHSTGALVSVVRPAGLLHISGVTPLREHLFGEPISQLTSSALMTFVMGCVGGG